MSINVWDNVTSNKFIEDFTEDRKSISSKEHIDKLIKYARIADNIILQEYPMWIGYNLVFLGVIWWIMKQGGDLARYIDDIIKAIKCEKSIVNNQWLNVVNTKHILTRGSLKEFEHIFNCLYLEKGE